MTSPAIAALRRLRPQPPAPRPERCALCAHPLEPRHEHLLDVSTRQLECACTACALLFDSTSTHKRRLPRDSRLLANFDLSPQEWASLQIPIRLAFLSRTSQSPDMLAAFPSPAGAVTAALPADVWAVIESRHPELARLVPDVEALLVNRMQTPHLAFVTPLDRCYELTGVIRSVWRGLSGGAEVQRRLAQFCAELAREARIA
ncbi:MAG TPA: DUF5947 family protein [Terriglobales bacterium]|nr:DUF5947 family protein [Terriglobales bacterium]